MRFNIPNSAFIGNIDPVLRAFDPSEPGELTITANPKWVSVHPVIIAMIGAIGSQLHPKNIHWQNTTATSIHYFTRIGLFKTLGIKTAKTIQEHEPSGRFIPLTNIKTAEEQSEFIKEIIPILHLKKQQAEPIKYVISELLRNVIEHAATTEGAWVCAQYYERSNIVRIGIADTGQGIKKSLNNTLNTNTDEEAIRYALIPGVSGSTQPYLNAGAGLFFTKTIAKINRDFFLIYSGNATYKLLKTPTYQKISIHADPFKDRHSKKEVPYWQGTVVGIDISTDNTKAFSALMKDLRITYSEKLQEKKRIIKVRPRFT